MARKEWFDTTSGMSMMARPRWRDNDGWFTANSNSRRGVRGYGQGDGNDLPRNRVAQNLISTFHTIAIPPYCRLFRVVLPCP